MTMPATLDPSVCIDWGNDGSFADPYDDVTNDTLADPGVSIQQGRDGARSLNPPMINAADFTVVNEDGKYSQDRASSPIYQLIVPGKPVKVSARHGTRTLWRSHRLWRDHTPWRGRAAYTLARGVVDTIDQTAAIGNRRVAFGVLGLAAKLRGRTINLPIHESIRTDQALALVLDAVGWPAADRALSVGDTTLLYWWADERDAWDAAVELLTTEGPGALYEDGAGVIHFENRNYRALTTRSMTSQAVFYDRTEGARTPWRSHVRWRAHRFYRGRTSGLFFTDLRPDMGFKAIVNRATFTTRRRAFESLQRVWDYGAVLSLTPNESLTLIARPSDPFRNAIQPAEGTDFSISAGSLVSIQIDYDSGNLAVIRMLASGSGATVAGVTSTGLQLRAEPLTVVSETTVQNSVDAAPSIATFGERTMQVAGWADTDPNQARAVCDAWVSRYQVQRPQITITVKNADGAHLRQMLDRFVSDRITLIEANTGLSADVWIERKELRISGASGRMVEAVLSCEKVEEVSGSAWDVGLWNSALWGR